MPVYLVKLRIVTNFVNHYSPNTLTRKPVPRKPQRKKPLPKAPRRPPDNRSVILKIWDYIRVIWEGKDEKLSLKRILAIIFSYDFISNFSYAVQRWQAGKTMEGLSSALMIEGGLIAALLGMTAFFNLRERALDYDNYGNTYMGGDMNGYGSNQQNNYQINEGGDQDLPYSPPPLSE